MTGEHVRPRLLDLFCGAGGAAMGYHRAGFEIVGVDIKPQPRYPFTFIQADALNLPVKLSEFDAIHASPPCQAWSALTRFSGRSYPKLIEPIRARLLEAGLPFVIENVQGAPLRSPVVLCGSSFGLDVRRHRLFESNIPIFVPDCNHSLQTPRFANTGTRRRAMLSSVIGVYGGGHFKGDNLAYRSEAMGIDWMTMNELSEAIPPAYSEFIGKQLISRLGMIP